MSSRGSSSPSLLPREEICLLISPPEQLFLLHLAILSTVEAHMPTLLLTKEGISKKFEGICFQPSTCFPLEYFDCWCSIFQSEFLVRNICRPGSAHSYVSPPQELWPLSLSLVLDHRQLWDDKYSVSECSHSDHMCFGIQRSSGFREAI